MNPFYSRMSFDDVRYVNDMLNKYVKMILKYIIYMILLINVPILLWYREMKITI